MKSQKLSKVLFYLYSILLVIFALFSFVFVQFFRNEMTWISLFLAEDRILLVVLLVSAIVMEAALIRWSTARYTTLISTVFLLTLLLAQDARLLIATAGLGAFLGYGLLCELRIGLRRTPAQALLKTVFYTAQSVVAAAIASSLYLLLLDRVSILFALRLLIAGLCVVIHMFVSRNLVTGFNRLMSLQWPGSMPIPRQNLLVFVLTAIAPIVTTWFYQTIQGNSVLVGMLGESAKYLAVLVFWPLSLLVFYVAFPYLTANVESEEIRKEYDKFVRYSDTMLNMEVVVGIIVREMREAFRCDDCIVYSWNEQDKAYEFEGGAVGEKEIFRDSIDSIPGLVWPGQVELRKGRLGELADKYELSFLRGDSAQDILRQTGSPSVPRTSILFMPLIHQSEETGQVLRIGFIVLIARGRSFSYYERVLANDRVTRQTSAHIGLRQARSYRDARQFFVKVDAGISRSAEVFSATQSLFAKGIDPAVFMNELRARVQEHTLTEVVRGIVEGHSPGDTVDALGDAWIESLYERMRQRDQNLPVLSQDLKEDIQTVIVSLSSTFAIPYRWWPTPRYGEISAGMREVYALFLPALEVRTVEEIVAFGTKLSDSEHLEHLAVDFGETIGALSELKKVIRIVKESQESSYDTQTRADYLSEAWRMLIRESDKGPSSGEQVILAQVRDVWAGVVSNTRAELLGPSDLRLQLAAREATATAEGVVLALELSNQGKITATNITLRLAESDDYEVLDLLDLNDALEALVPGQSRRLSFRIQPNRGGFVRIALEATWDDAIRAERKKSFADRVILSSDETVFVRIENPYVPGPPLRPGSGLFYGREDVFEFVREHIGRREQHNVLVLVGPRRTGKTSLALHLSQALDQDRYVVTYVDGQALGTEPGLGLFLRDLSWMICDGLEEYGIEYEPLSLADSEGGIAEKFRREFLPGALKAINGRSLVLVFDEFEELQGRIDGDKVGESIFQFLRHLMQHVENLAFVFVGTHRLQKLTQDYWSVLFSLALYKRIGFLEEEAARRLITEPTEQDVFDPLAVERIIELTAGHPYFLQLLCHYLIDLRNRRRYHTITDQHVSDAIPEVLFQAEGHLTQLWRMATPAEKMTMASAARVLARQDSVHANDILEQLAAYRVERTPQEILLAEEALAERELFERLNGDAHTPHYRFKVNLIRQWIDHNQPLSLVVRSVF